MFCLAQEFLSNFIANPEVKGIIMGVFAADAALRTFLEPRTSSKYFGTNATFIVRMYLIVYVFEIFRILIVVFFQDIWNDIKKGLNSHEKDLNHNFVSFNKLVPRKHSYKLS